MCLVRKTQTSIRFLDSFKVNFYHFKTRKTVSILISVSSIEDNINQMPEIVGFDLAILIT